MIETAEKTFTDYTLPASIVTKIDVAHLVDEVEQMDAVLTTEEVRVKGGASAVSQPIMSQQLTDFLQENALALSEATSRMHIVKQLRALKDHVPVIHMTFAVKADAMSLQQIALWLRENIDKQAVVAVGLQPGLVAGVYMRTPNHVHDMSLRGKLAEQRSVLAEELGALRGNR